jgi:hypothetical protein
MKKLIFLFILLLSVSAWAGPEIITGGGGSMSWPSGSAGVPNYNGSSAWGTSYSATNPIPFNFLTGVQAAGDAAFPQGYIYGLNLSNDAGDADHYIGIAAGSARDSGNANNMVLAAALVKRMGATWAVGTNAGGACAGTAIPTNGTWHVFLIKRTDTNVVDVCGDPTLTPTLPTNYSVSRLIGSYRTDGTTPGKIINGTWRGSGEVRTFEYLIPILDVTTATSGTNAVSAALSVPGGIVVKANFSFYAGGLANFSSLTTTDQAPSNTNTPGAMANGTVGNAFSVFTNTSSQIRYRQGSNAGMYIVTVGWEQYL